MLRLLQEQGEPVIWRVLVEQLQVSEPRRITQLRQLLRGLERNGDIVRDHTGSYSIAQSLQAEELLVEKQGRGLAVAGKPLLDTRRSGVRAGDVVLVHWVGDEPKVLEVVSHSDQLLVGVLNLDGRYPYVQGLGEFKGRVSIETRLPKHLVHDTPVHVRITGQQGRRLVGEVVGEVAHDNVLELAVHTALVNHDIPHEWPADVLQAADKLPSRVQPGRFKDRVDLTSLPLVTIDGETAKDFDDAVYTESLGQEGWRLVVAIADVAHYVKTGSPLDVEAARRGTSVYFPQTVVPMLPEALSNELCSLKPHVPRLSLVCDMQIDGEGEIAEYQFYEACIHSHARLTYTQVQTYLDTGSGLPSEYQAVRQSIEQLQQLYTALRSARERRGALDFATREGSLVLTQGRVTEIQHVARLVAHQLIEEAMITANVCAALFLESRDSTSLYRVHEPPDVSKTEELRQALAVAGVRLPGGVLDPAAIATALSQLPAGADEWLYGQLALRSLQQAIYTPDNRGHFGLALQRYMHFTSPIRRYPDLLVHRAIKAQLAQMRGSSKQFRPPTADELHWLGEQCSQFERRAESAAWFVEGWLKCEFLKAETGNTLNGIVAAVTEFGLFVELEGYYLQGLLHVANLGSDYFHFKAQSFSLVGERSGRQFRLGDKLKVVVAEVEPSQGKVDLLLAGNAGAQRRRGRRR